MIGFYVCGGASGVSLGIITFISVDRFLALHYHMRYADPCQITCRNDLVDDVPFIRILFLG